MRKRNVLLILFTVVFTGLVGGGFFFLPSSYLTNKIRVVLVDTLEKELNLPITIGHISGNVLTGLSIKQFAIADKQPRWDRISNEPDKPDLILTDEIKVKYKLLGLLRGKFLVKQFNFTRPQINAYIDQNGKLNLTRLIPEAKTDSSVKFPLRALIAHISVENGTIYFEDEKRNLKVTISGIYSHVNGPLDRWNHSGKLEVHDGRIELNGIETKIDEFKMQFEFLENMGELKKLRLVLGHSVLTIAGKVEAPQVSSQQSGEPPAVETQINLHMDLADLQKFLPQQFQVEGLAQAEVEASGTPSEITGRFGLKLPFARLNQIQLEDVVAKMEFTQDGVRLTDFHGALASGKLTGGANVELTPEGLSYNGWLQLVGLQAEQLLPIVIELPEDFLVVKGTVNGKLQFSGGSPNPNDLKLDGHMQLTEGTLNNLPIRVSEARYQIENDRLSLTANFDEAQIRLTGILGLGGQPNLDLNITQIDVGKLSRILRVPDLSGDGVLTGKVSSDPSFSASLRIPDAALYEVPIGVLTADFHYEDGRVFLHPVRLVKGESETTLHGVARVEGDIPVDFIVRAHPFQIADYVRLAGADYPVEGIATGDLVLDGTLSQLNGQGTLQVVSGKAWGLAFDSLTLPLKIENYVVKMPDFELLARGQRGVLNTQMTREGNYEIDLQSGPLQLAELAIARGMTDFQLDAALVVKATGKGNVTDPRVDVAADFSDVTYAGKPLRDVHLAGVYTKDGLHFEGVGFDDTCQIQGILEPVAGTPYQVSVHGTDVDITPVLRIFSDVLGDELTGRADGTLEMAGVLADPTQFWFKMSLPAVALHLNGQKLINPSPINFSFADNLWHIQSFELADSRDFRPFLRASGIFSVASVNQHIGRSANSQSPIANPQSNDAIYIGFDTASPTQSDPRSAIHNLLDFTVESEGFELERLAEVLGFPPIISGVARYKLIGKGKVNEPQFTLDWSLADVSIKTPVEPIIVTDAEGRLVYKDRNLAVEEADFDMLGNLAHLRGSMPIDLNLTSIPFEERFVGENMRIELHSDGFRLAALEGFFPQISQFRGRLSLSAQITGNPLQPVLAASIDVAKTRMQLFDFPRPIENLKANFQVHGGDKSSDDLITINVKSADWQLGGGRYRAKGDWRLSKAEREPSLNSIFNALKHHEPVAFRLQLNGDGVNLMDLANYVMQRELHDIEGRGNISLNLQGNGYSPDRMSATLVCDDLHINIKDRHIQNMNEIRFHFAQRILKLEPVQIGEETTAWLDTTGAIDLDGNIELDLELDQMPFAVLMPAITLTLFDMSLLQLKGELTSQVTVRGTLTDPIMLAKWDADGRFGNAKLKDIGDAKYQEKLLEVQDTQRVAGVNNQLKIYGSIPINLAFQPLNLADRFLDLPIHLGMYGRQVPLTRLALLFHPLIEDFSGTADIDLRIQGTTASPHLEGEFSLRDGMLKFKHFDMPISAGKLDLRASKGEISEELSFRIGEGRYNAQIGLQMNGLFPTDFEVKQFSIGKAQIADFARNFLKGEIISNLRGYIDAEASVHLPVNRIITPGETAWTPKVTSFHPANLIKYATGVLNIRNVFVKSLVEGLDYGIRNPAPIKIRLEDQVLTLEEGFILEDLEATTEVQRLKLTGFGNWELGKNLRFHMDMHNFNLGFISDLVPEAYSVRGFVNAVLDIRGTDAQPEISFEWETPKLSINQAEVDAFTGKIMYKDQQLRMVGKERRKRAYLSIGGNRANMSGLIPFSLSFLDFKAETLPRDIEGRLDVEIENLDFLPLIIPEFGFADATGGGHVTIGGRLSSPQLKGVANLRNLEFELPESNIHVEKTRVDLDFTDRELKIRRCEGRLNGGTYKISGLLKSDWHRVYYMAVSARLRDDPTFEQSGVYQITCREADLAMRGDVVINGTVKLPPLSGSIYINKGEYTQHWKELVKEWFDQRSAIQFEVRFDYPIVRDVQLDLDVVAPNNLWVKSNLGEIETEVSVNGKIVGPVQRPIFDGRVDLLQGEFSFFAIDPQFTIKKKTSYVENRNPFEFNPWYEIYAETTKPIRGVEVVTTDGQSRTRDLQITAHLSGYLSKQHRPEFQVEVLRKGAGEEYQLTQNQIVSILTLGEIDPFASETASTNTTSDLFLRHSQRYLGNRVADAVGFVDEVRFDISPDAFEASQFLFTKALSERFFLTSAFTFQLHAEPRIEVEYLINQHITVKGEKNEQGKFGIDLKLEQKF